MIPENYYAPLFIIAGICLIALTLIKRWRGKKEGWFVTFGRIVFAVFLFCFAFLMLKIGK